MKFLLLLVLSSCSLFDPQQSMAPRKTVMQQSAPLNARPDAGPRKRVVILPFLDANPARSPEFREKARQAFIMELNRVGGILAVDSSELKVSPSKYVDKGEYKLKELGSASQTLGVNAILEGKIIDLKVKQASDQVGIIRKVSTEFEAIVRVRMASSRGGREIFNTTKTVQVDQPGTRVAERVNSDRYIEQNPELLMTIVKDAFLDFTPQINAAMEKLAWEGRIAAISGDRIYLNVGKISGLQLGDLLKVSAEGEDIYDPEAGTSLGRAPGKLKGTLEVNSYFGTDGAIAVIHSGAGFKENDRVELYQ